MECLPHPFSFPIIVHVVENLRLPSILSFAFTCSLKRSFLSLIVSFLPIVNTGN
ncbi:MAG: hypothetical protein ACTSYC_06725 [Promethearchaeota archaeon]